MSANMHFELPRALVLNANDRKHFHEKAPIIRNLRAMGARAARDVTPMERATITIRIGWPDRRPRDADNLSPTTKALIDGIVGDGGLLPNDSDRHVVSVTKAGYVAGKTGIVVLDFEFIQVSHDDPASRLHPQENAGRIGRTTPVDAPTSHRGLTTNPPDVTRRSNG